MVQVALEPRLELLYAEAAKRFLAKTSGCDIVFRMECLGAEGMGCPVSCCGLEELRFRV